MDIYSVNAKCPCGSDKKFKKCCLLNETDDENPKKIMREMHKKYKKNKCYHPEKDKCKGKIKDCHTIQNNKILNNLSVDGKVYMFFSNLKLNKGTLNGVKTNIKSTFIWEQLLVEIGRNSATTFRGFCDYHDSVLFKDIEIYNFNQEDKQFFQYAYRALIHRLYSEELDILKTRDLVKCKSGEDLKNENCKTGFLGMLKVRELTYNDLLNEKVYFDNAIINQNFDILSNYYMELPYEIKFAFTGRIVVEHDLVGRKINNGFSFESEEHPKSFYLTVIPENGKTIILFSTLKKNILYFETSIKEFIKCSMEIKQNILLNLMIRYCDVIVFSPNLLKKITGVEKNIIVKNYFEFIVPYPSTLPLEKYKDLKGSYLPNLFLK